ncbi:MAG: capsule assembly Wzi family protein [Bacteroidetes bacterium]|jgi:hypothetical protein|nr:capsule assembly Wzi family protein [Bacteroidota bacterium]
MATVASVAQSVSVPVRHEVYEFLKKMEAQGRLSEYRDIIRPLSRKHVAAMLLRVERSAQQLTDVDLRRLTFFKEEFGDELGLADSSWTEAPRRWHPLTYVLDGGVLNVDFNAAFLTEHSQGDWRQRVSNGLRMYGYAFDHVGFSFHFADNREIGTNLDPVRALTPEDGLIISKPTGRSFEYDFTDVELTYETGGMTFALEKIPMWWSTGRRGSLMLSPKAPAAPQIRFRAELAEWLDFTYVHAELSSLVLDSLRSYHTFTSSLADYIRPVYRSKYMAAHVMEASVTDWLDVSFGESIVYSDRTPQLIYLIPVMFFKSGEHYNKDTDNSQFFFSVDVNPGLGLNLYGSLFIDEIATSEIFNPDKVRNQLGYTLGIQSFDLLVANTELMIEYSRLNPWVYSHRFQAATFQNAGYDMGHWIGQNADLLSLEVVYRPWRSVRASAWYDALRKGGRKDVYYQYNTPSQPFLYGPVRRETSFGMRVLYEPVRDLFVEASARSYRVTDEGVPAASHSDKPEYSLSVRYGLR